MQKIDHFCLTQLALKKNVGKPDGDDAPDSEQNLIPQSSILAPLLSIVSHHAKYIPPLTSRTWPVI